MKPNKTIKVFLADDHEVLREGLCALLKQEPDIDVVGTAGDGQQAIQMSLKLKPDVVVMDIGMPELNGIDATRKVSAELPDVAILCLSVHRESRLVAAMLEAGASGYLLKKSAAQEIVHAIRTVASGETYLSPPIATDVVERHVRGKVKDSVGGYSMLTEREREVLQLIAEGHHTKVIAARLNISSKTILAHRENLMRKLEIDSIANLTRYALQEGITVL